MQLVSIFCDYIGRDSQPSRFIKRCKPCIHVVHHVNLFSRWVVAYPPKAQLSRCGCSSELLAVQSYGDFFNCAIAFLLSKF